MHQFNTDISGALEMFENAFGGGCLFSPPPAKNQRSLNKTDSMEIINKKALTSYPLISYLKERKIAIGVARKYLIEIHYRKGNRLYFTL